MWLLVNICIWVIEQCAIMYILNAILFAYPSEENLEMHCISFGDLNRG